MHVEVLITPVHSVVNTKHGIPERSRHNRMAQGWRVEALQGVNKVDGQKGPDAILECLHLDGHVLAALILKSFVPFVSKLVELSVHNLDVVVKHV